jgi:hypothetical protein
LVVPGRTVDLYIATPYVCVKRMKKLAVKETIANALPTVKLAGSSYRPRYM